jgi:uncharacterized phage infection (PIP) family protein YhgE
MEKMKDEDEVKSSNFSEELSFSESPRGTEVLKMRVEKVIAAYNSAIEENQQRTELVKKAVMQEASCVVAKYEEAQARKQEEISDKMNDFLDQLSTELAEMREQEEELKRFSSSLVFFVKDLPR